MATNLPSPTKLVKALASMATSISTVEYKGRKCFRYVVEDPYGDTIIVRTTPCTFATKRYDDANPNGLVQTGLDWAGLEAALDYIGSCFDAADNSSTPDEWTDADHLYSLGF